MGVSGCMGYAELPSHLKNIVDGIGGDALEELDSNIVAVTLTKPLHQTDDEGLKPMD